jgi:hypothetical protein
LTTDRTIGPTPERLRKAGENVEAFTPDENVNHRAIRMLDGHVLGYLQKKSVISGDQYNAGIQYYEDWYFGGLAHSGVIDPGRIIVDGGKIDHMSDKQLAALTRYHRALKALCDEHADIMLHCVLREMPVSQYGFAVWGHKNQKLASLAARTRLMDALSALDRHYYGRRNMGHRSSHAPDYRPMILGADHHQEAEPAA